MTKDRKPRTSAKTAKTKSTKAATSAAKRSARPTKPAAKKLAKPGAKKPAKPAAKKPTKPGAKKPTKPGAKKPTKPAAKKLAKKPAKPAAKKPAKPAAKKLAKKPAKPAAKKPAKPAAKKPAETPKASLSSPSSPPPPTATPEHVHDESCSHDQGEISRRLTSDVASYGWHVVLVEADEEGPAFGYTVGAFESYGVPEVLMVGLDPEVMHSVLNEVVARMRDGARFEVGKPYPGLIERYEVVFKPVHASHYEGWLGQAIRYHEEVPFPVLQCVWPDMEGRFPWDEKATPGLSIQQPVLDELWA